MNRPPWHSRPFAIVILAATVLWTGTPALAREQSPPVAGATASGDGAAPGTTAGPDLTAIRTALLSGSGRPGDIIADLKSVLADHPDSAEAHLLLGIAYRTIGADMLAEAIAEFRQALAFDPSLVAGRFYLAQAYLDLNRPDRAREELDAALATLPARPPQFVLLLASAEQRAGHPARALELAREVLAADPRMAQAAYLAAMALLALDRRPEAIGELERLVASGAAPPDVAAALGQAYLDDGRAADALPLLKTAAQAVPGRPDLQVQLARALRLTGQIEAADQTLAQALPPGAHREASEFYETLDADIQLETAIIRLAQGRIDDADAALAAAVALRPDHGPTLRHLAELRLRQGRRDEAATHARAARDAGETLTAELSALLNGT